MAGNDTIRDEFIECLPAKERQLFNRLSQRTQQEICHQLDARIKRYHPELFDHRPVQSDRLTTPSGLPTIENPEAENPLVAGNQLSKGGGWLQLNQQLKLNIVSGREGASGGIGCIGSIIGASLLFSQGPTPLALFVVGGSIFSLKKALNYDDFILADIPRKKFFKVNNSAKNQRILPQFDFASLHCLSVNSKVTNTKNGKSWKYEVIAIHRDGRTMSLSSQSDFETALEYCARLCAELDIPFNENVAAETILDKSRVKPIQL